MVQKVKKEKEIGIGQKYKGEQRRSEGDGRSTYSARCRLSVHEKEMHVIEMHKDSWQLPQQNHGILPTIDQFVSHQFAGYHRNDITEFFPPQLNLALITSFSFRELRTETVVTCKKHYRKYMYVSTVLMRGSTISQVSISKNGRLLLLQLQVLQLVHF